MTQRVEQYRDPEPKASAPERAPAVAARALTVSSTAQAEELRSGEAGAAVHSGAADTPAALQAKELQSTLGEADILQTAAAGVRGSAGQLPFLEQIQRSFGHFDVRDVQAHVGGDAARANEAIGAQAYTMGDRVAFGRVPDLRTAAHEAAHVVQQKAGVQLQSGVGRKGDLYERHADAVADRVVQGKSAEELLACGPKGKPTYEPERPAHAGGGESVQMVRATTDHLRNPSTHPERAEFLARCRRAGVSGAAALWNDICTGILNNDFALLQTVATAIVSTLVTQRNKLALWSGGDKIKAYAQSRGYQTLEATEGGQLFDKLKLYNVNQWSWPKVRLLWGAISQAFSRQALGRVNCFLRYPGYVFRTWEHGEMQDLQTAGQVTVRYHPMAVVTRGRSQEVHELRSDGEIAQRSNPFKSYDNAMKAIDNYRAKYGNN